MRKRDMARRLAKKFDTPGNWEIFRELRNKVVGTPRKAKIASFPPKITNLSDHQPVPSIISNGDPQPPIPWTKLA